jgi:hypothetical protein
MEIAGKLSRIQLDAHPGQGKQGLCLGGKRQAMGILEHVERLYTDPVTTNQEPATATVPKGKVEHAIEAKNEIIAKGIVGMEQHLAVGAGLEREAHPLQFGPQLPKIRSRHYRQSTHCHRRWRLAGAPARSMMDSRRIAIPQGPSTY